MKKIVSFFGDNSEMFKKLNQKAAEYAKEKGLAYKWAPQLPFNEANVVGELRDADAGIIDIEPYGESIFSQIKGKTEILVRFGVGYDQVDLKAASDYGIPVARTTGANTNAVAEMALSLILSCKRMIAFNQKCVQTGNWMKEIAHETIGSTVGILGFGNIGQRLAKLLSGFDCDIIVYDPFPNKEKIAAAGAELVTLDELFKRADAISIHVPYSEDTYHMIDKKLLSSMKSTAVIVNTARGKIVNEEDLYQVLKDKKIAGAGFDVFAQEPLPLTSPLIGLDNAVLTPHVSSQTEESLWNIYAMAIDIAAGFFEGKCSPHILNPDFDR